MKMSIKNKAAKVNKAALMGLVVLSTSPVLDASGSLTDVKKQGVETFNEKNNASIAFFYLVGVG
ncbi:hypothetical protein I3271_09330 [Photobacterium leiognathi]|uniref:hypothetical protein n=1 Tax=Photobacterium leiognathi TaxID=553611 RepID=UPI001EE06FEE|nr:hypothetical protein [Photobacterium leiognathi]MCG3884889.1 hypothetical protein [Photobacterium leiognathi]